MTRQNLREMLSDIKKSFKQKKNTQVCASIKEAQNSAVNISTGKTVNSIARFKTKSVKKSQNITHIF